MADQHLPITLFCYPGSPYSRRVSWYLDLRHIAYTPCIQAPQPPRPLLSRTLHLQYRRIPVLAIGASLLCDSRLILAKLEVLFPPSPQHPGLLPPSPTGDGSADAAAAATAELLESWSTAPDLFFAAAGLLPPSLPLLRDPAFIADRAELSGGTLRLNDVDAVEARRPACRSAVARAMGWMEEGFLRDGRSWVLGGDEATLADLQAVWVFDWLVNDRFMEGALGVDLGAWERRFPRTVAWVRRWRAWVQGRGVWDAEAEGAVKELREVGTEEVAKRVFGEGVGFVGVEEEFDEVGTRELGLEKGAVVEVWPTDYGSPQRDRGRLVGLRTNEVVVEVDVEEKGKCVRLHFPRTGFAVRRVE